jgi:hypothetical protein
MGTRVVITQQDRLGRLFFVAPEGERLRVFLAHSTPDVGCRVGCVSYLLVLATGGVGWAKVAAMLVANIVTALSSIIAETGSHNHAPCRYSW